MSDTTSYLYGKDNVSAHKILRYGDFPGLSTTFGELEATREHVMEAIHHGRKAGIHKCSVGQRRGTTVGEARYRLYTMKFSKLLEVICHHL